ncbi:MAG: hypothetical protein ACKOQ4_16780 [Mycobacterium sp.]
MTLRSSASRLLAAAVVGLGLLSAPAIAGAAPCPGGQWADPITGLCWSQNNPSNSYGGSGNIPCLPGRLGLCLGALQNTPIPGSTLAGPNPNGTWP